MIIMLFQRRFYTNQVSFDVGSSCRFRGFFWKAARIGTRYPIALLLSCVLIFLDKEMLYHDSKSLFNFRFRFSFLIIGRG